MILLPWQKDAPLNTEYILLYFVCAFASARIPIRMFIVLCSHYSSPFHHDLFVRFPSLLRAPRFFFITKKLHQICYYLNYFSDKNIAAWEFSFVVKKNNNNILDAVAFESFVWWCVYLCKSKVIVLLQSTAAISSNLSFIRILLVRFFPFRVDYSARSLCYRAFSVYSMYSRKVFTLFYAISSVYWVNYSVAASAFHNAEYLFVSKNFLCSSHFSMRLFPRERMHVVYFVVDFNQNDCYGRYLEWAWIICSRKHQ